MRKLLTSFAAAGLAAAALAMAGPVTAHAAGTSGGPCHENNSQEFQSIDYGVGNKHSFTNSKDNCVVFYSYDSEALLNDSYNNYIQIGGAFNKVDDFNHSDHNAITFDPGSIGNELNARNSYANTVVFSSAGDFVDLVGAVDDTITVSGSGAHVFVGGTGGVCAITSNETGFVLC